MHLILYTDLRAGGKKKKEKEELYWQKDNTRI